jgi:hypothetical protein
MKPVPHPPYFPDLAPSDFCLFSYVKGCLAGLSLEGAERFREAVQAILEGIGKVTLQAIFLKWMDCLRKCITTNAQYTDLTKINVMQESRFIPPVLRCSPLSGTPCTLADGRPIFMGAIPDSRKEMDTDQVQTFIVW